MYDMFIILFFFVGMLIVSYIIQHFIWARDLGPLNAIKNLLLFTGVFIHELSHFIMAILVGVKPESMKVHFRGRFGNISPHGSVNLEVQNYTFLQCVLIGLAPLFVSTWSFLYILGILFSDQAQHLHVFVFFLLVFLLISVITGAAPSKPDFRNMIFMFKQDPRYSIYQVILALLSGVLIWAALFYFEIELIIDIFYYLLVGIGYYVLKYMIKGLVSIKNSINRWQPLVPIKLNYGKFTRARFKPTPPKKLGKKEAPW